MKNFHTVLIGLLCVAAFTGYDCDPCEDGCKDESGNVDQECVDTCRGNRPAPATPGGTK